MKLYKVKSISQMSGTEIITYIATDSIAKIEQEVADILLIEPLTPFEEINETN
jgi:hypothetical protein